jgi:hypothetical protein
MDRRLQRRYYELVREHTHALTPTTTGPSALPGDRTAFASTQALWRFVNNDAVSLAALMEPVREAGRDALTRCAAGPALIVHDWSVLQYAGHSAKADRLRRTHAADVGYELGTALLVDAAAGRPLAPMELRLRTGQGLVSSRPGGVTATNNVEEVLGVMAAAAAWGLGRLLVHVIDREADSVDHYRRWHAARHRFLVRADADRRVRWQGQEIKLAALAERLWSAGGFAATSPELAVGDTAGRLHVAATVVVLHRPAHRRLGGRPVRVYGPPLPLRLVATRVVAATGTVLAEWLLLSNVSGSIPAETLARWYAWRWRIESFFKLLKTAGQQVERWEQTTPAAIAKRLAIASMSCLMVWLLHGDPRPMAATLRRLLIRLSGRQMKHGVGSTAPALLAGLEKLLAALDLLDQYSPDDLRCLLQQCLPQFFSCPGPRDV